MYLYRLGCRVLEPCFPTIHPNMDGRRAPRFPKRVFHVARNAIFMVPDTRLSWFPKRSKVPETRFSCCPERDFHGSRGALSWFPKRAFMVPETRFHGSRNDLSWFPKRPFMVPEMTSMVPETAFMVPETRFHGSRNDLSWFPKRPFMVPETTSMVPETAFMVPEMRSWFPKHGSRTDARPGRVWGAASHIKAWKAAILIFMQPHAICIAEHKIRYIAKRTSKNSSN